MTTFISGSNGYSFNSTFRLPEIFNDPGVFSSNYATIRTPERMYATVDTFVPSRFPSSSHKEVDVSGTSLSLTGTAITGGMVEDIAGSYSVSGFTSPARNSYAILDINLSVADINAAAATSPAAAWALMTNGDDVFYATKASLEGFTPPYWSQLINAGNGNDVIYASPGRDYLAGGAGSNAIYAGDGTDTIFAGNNAAIALQDVWSSAFGEGDSDTIYAGWGCNAWLDGGNGDDVITDGFGVDILVGGAGNDYLLAGTGTNYFIVNAADVRADEVDTLYYFSAANNYLQLPAAWAGAVGTYFDGTSTFLVLPTGSSNFYVQIYGTAAVDVWSHVYFA